MALVPGAVDVEPVEPLKLKGKAEPVRAFRLLSVHALERSHTARFVGRGAELALIREAWARALAEQRCEPVTIIGEAGVGKSRLVDEALSGLDARVVAGRCLPYGEAITYWPVVEILKQLDALPSDPVAAASIRSLLGRTEDATSADEIAWSFRKLLEEQAPRVAVFDDLHWGEETLLDLVEGIGLLASGAPILLLCMARPELVVRRPQWPVAMRLEPLGEEHVAELIGDRVGAPLRERIARAAGGNPLFLTEMLAMAQERDDVEVPPSLNGLLAARLDQLDVPERRVLEHGAVEGEIFHRGAVQALTPEETHVTPRLAALTRQELIRPSKAQLPGEDGFRFRHLLIRDAAYDGLSKVTRADLHARFAAWLEERGIDLPELDELLGYHLEQAHRYRLEVGLPDDRELRDKARRHLAAAGWRAHVREDYAAATTLLERAEALTPPGEIDLRLEIDLNDALLNGPRAHEALRRSGVMAKRAAAADDRIGERCLRIQEGYIRLWLDSEGSAEHVAALVEEALPMFEAAHDDFALYFAYRTLGQVADVHLQGRTAADAYDRAAVHAERAGLGDCLVVQRAGGRLWGATPVPEVLAWLREQNERDQRHSVLRKARVWMTAMLGHIDEARALYAELHAEMAERGASEDLAAMPGLTGAYVELLAGNPAAAVALGEESCRQLEELGRKGVLSSVELIRAEAHYELGELEDADARICRAVEIGASDDVFNQMLWRQVRAKVLACRGERAEAERLAREAVALGDRTESIDDQARAYSDLGEVLSLAGRTQDAAAALEQALARFEARGNLVEAGRVRARVEALREAERA